MTEAEQITLEMMAAYSTNPSTKQLLLQKLSTGTETVPTAEAKEALRYLKSMEKYQPKTHREGHRMRINNPVVGAKPNASYAGQHTSYGFSTDTGMDRPINPRSKLQTQAITAVNAQLLDAMPSARNPIPGNDLPSMIEFGAVFDEKDYRLQKERGKPTNQRASAYKRFTKGAFNAYPSKEQFNLDWSGYTEKIDSNTWQPRNDKGRFMKYVKWDPKDTLRPLATAAGRRILRANPYGQAFATILDADNIVEGVTGVSPIKTVAGVAKDNIEQGRVPKPMTLIRPSF